MEPVLASPPDPEQPSLEKKLVRTSPALWILAVFFALLLGGLGSRLLTDLAELFPRPDLNRIERRLLDPLEEQRRTLQASPDPHAETLERARRDLADLETTLRSAEDNWRTWLQTRATLGGKEAEDTELRSRRDQLESLRRDRDQASQALAKLRQAASPRERELRDLDRQITRARETAQAEHDAAMRPYKLKVLSARLALVIPVWIVAAWLWTRRQRTRYLTLVWGYFAFAAWMLLFGIWPFLPHYGGYFPLALGSAASVWGSISLVRLFNRRAPLRRRRIVDRAIARHLCPGCDRDYLVGREVGIDVGLTRKTSVRHFDSAALRPRHCGSCGLALFGACASCGHEQIVHLDRCGGCGRAWTASASASTPSGVPQAPG